ncbi:SDR family oxidoreductase [Candidimonas sp. SYP-B2681]|uniref:SDR family NAD(P)-dependent oxidoreductase n=1 Tax=Candidimonas sp. SYP-B2681 TaxID=2497686 RepID=UPI000F87166D|nr:SDR family oxidoreductase [Candidimonas sp. SYP-B2681]RTZ41522.1 SDR family oxidoreductase [Candidimonas sp. SYP-B2681]
MLDMTGKVVFIAGAGSVGNGWGNGKATAVLMARQGAKVFGVDRDNNALTSTSAAMAEEGHRDWVPRACDMTVSGDVESAVNDCLARYGRIDVLVNNVGGSAPGDPVSMSEEAWDAQMNLNLKTAFLGCKHVLPIMERQFSEDGYGGAIVNLSSIGCMSFQPEGRVSVAYAASKAGVLSFSRSVAIAYCKKGIRVNTVVPGVMHTPLVETRLVSQLGVTDTEAFLAKRHASVPIGRMGDAWDVANAVVFLASDEARYITATQLVVDGGMTAARPTV